MSCPNQVGVKNILISFRNCDTNEVIKFVSHKQANDEDPTVRACSWVNEPLTNGFVRRRASNASMQITVIRNYRVPLAYYQGCASVDVQVEMFSGLVYTGVSGSVGGEDGSNGHEVTLDITFQQLDELLPAGEIQATAGAAIAAAA